MNYDKIKEHFVENIGMFLITVFILGIAIGIAFVGYTSNHPDYDDSGLDNESFTECGIHEERMVCYDKSLVNNTTVDNEKDENLIVNNTVKNDSNTG